MTSAFTCSQDALSLYHGKWVSVCVCVCELLALSNCLSCPVERGEADPSYTHTHTHTLAAVDTWLQRRMRCACGGCCQVKCSRRVWRIFFRWKQVSFWKKKMSKTTSEHHFLAGFRPVHVCVPSRSQLSHRWISSSCSAAHPPRRCVHNPAGFV